MNGRHRVPFNRPSMVGRELEYVAAAIASGGLAGAGRFGRLCEKWLEEKIGATRVLLTHSCTAALEMAAILSGVREGDEVILPSFTFVSTANAFVLRGARPVFVDVRPDTLNLDETLVEAAITARTRAIVPVHYAGVASDMAPLLDLAERRGLLVIEDAAQALGSTYRDRALGAQGNLGCFSFHETKNLVSGEGGALALRDAALVERAEIVREKGTDRARFLRGQVDKYTWVDVGSSYAPSELVAAFLFAQLEFADAVLERRLQIVDRYREAFADLEVLGRLRLPVVPGDCRPNGHLFYLLLPSEVERDELIDALDQAGINAVFHYVPLHTSPMGRRMGYEPGSLPVTEDSSRRLVRLPCFLELSGEQQESVIAAVRRYCARRVAASRSS